MPFRSEWLHGNGAKVRAHASHSARNATDAPLSRCRRPANSQAKVRRLAPSEADEVGDCSQPSRKAACACILCNGHTACSVFSYVCSWGSFRVDEIHSGVVLYKIGLHQSRLSIDRRRCLSPSILRRSPPFRWAEILQNLGSGSGVPATTSWLKLLSTRNSYPSIILSILCLDRHTLRIGEIPERIVLRLSESNA
jgi:hypothetical protein